MFDIFSANNPPQIHNSPSPRLNEQVDRDERALPAPKQS